MALDLAEQMRQAMRKLASGVCVVTSEDDSKNRCAMTASSVTSVSDSPPSLLVCVNQAARVGSAICSSEKFAVNLLGSQHEILSNNCANPEKVDSRFEEGDWLEDENTGLWYLQSAPAVVFCELAERFTHGTHFIYVGNITGAYFNDQVDEVLGYLNGSYRHLPLDI